MNLRSYLRGAGIGIIVTALVLMVSGGNKSHAMTDDEIRNRARELGMTEGKEVLTDAYEVATAPSVQEITEQPSAEPATEAATEAAIEPATEAATEAVSEAVSEAVTEAASETETASGETKESESSETAVAETAPSDTSEEKSADIKTVDEIIDDSLKDQQTTSLTSELTGEDKTKSELMADAVETEEESVSSISDTSSGFVSVHINSGSSSSVVAKALENAGAVSNAVAFDAFLCANGYDRHLSTGDFRIPAGASEGEIARILMRR